MNRCLRIIRVILSIIVIILGVVALVGNFDTRVIMSFMFACLGILQILNGIHCYLQGKKTEAILFFLTSLFILGAVIKIVITFL